MTAWDRYTAAHAAWEHRPTPEAAAAMVEAYRAWAREFAPEEAEALAADFAARLRAREAA